jgi:biotin carboxylase
MNRNEKIIILAGGADQKDLVLDLKSRGYFTILIDYNENPIARSVADEYIQQSTLDKELIYTIAKEKKANNIITACTDQALLTVAYVADKLGFPTQFSYQHALNMTNKIYMKKIMYESGIPTSRFIYVQAPDENISCLQYPLMVKPADCNGSFGVRRVYNKHELEKYFKEAVKVSRSGMAIIEEFKDGIEVGIDCFVHDGKAEILMLNQVNKKKISNTLYLIFQTFIPPVVSKQAKDTIQSIADRIAKVFSLDNTPLLIQTIINNDDVSVIEFAPRIGGASKHRTIKIKTGFDILHANVDACFGLKPDIITHENNKMYSRNHVYVDPCVFDRVEDIDLLISEDVIKEFVYYKTSGMEIKSFSASRDRIGSFLVEGDNIDELKEKIKKAVETLKVYAVDGREVLRRDIYN